MLLCNLIVGFQQTLSLYRDRSSLVYTYIAIDSLPRRPNHNLTDVSFQVSNPLRLLFRHLFRRKFGLGAILERFWVVSGRSWTLFGGSWGVLGRSWAILGRSRVVLGRSWAVLGGSWGLLGRSKIDPKIDPKLDSKTGRIATEKNGPNTTPVVVSELDRTQRNSDNVTQKSYQNRYRYD